jgi:hypothetical protein
MFNFMGLSLLFMVYFILFTDLFPSNNRMKKYIYAITGFIMSLFCVFIAPEVFTEINL